MKHYILCLFSVFVLLSCRQKENPKPAHASFSYFELSYESGGHYRFSFCVDSTRIFFLPQLAQPRENNKIKYGLLPDSIYGNIDTLVRNLKKISSHDPGSAYCHDCAETSIKIITGKDTVKIYQAGRIDVSIDRLIQQLISFEKAATLNDFTSVYFHMETAYDIADMPPRIQPK